MENHNGVSDPMASELPHLSSVKGPLSNTAKHHVAWHYIVVSYSTAGDLNKPAIRNFLLSFSVIFSYFELYPFSHTYVRLSPSEMHDFSLHDLHTFYLPPYCSEIISSKT